jgi:hypothetical protein
LVLALEIGQPAFALGDRHLVQDSGRRHSEAVGEGIHKENFRALGGI